MIHARKNSQVFSSKTKEDQNNMFVDASFVINAPDKVSSHRTLSKS